MSTLEVDIRPSRKQFQVAILLRCPVDFLEHFDRFLGVFKAKLTINRTSAKLAGPKPQLTDNSAGLRAFWALFVQPISKVVNLSCV